MGTYRDEQLFAAMDADAAGYRDGFHSGMSTERGRIAEALGVEAGILALLGSGQTEIELDALSAVSRAITRRALELNKGVEKE